MGVTAASRFSIDPAEKDSNSIRAPEYNVVVSVNRPKYIVCVRACTYTKVLERGQRRFSKSSPRV